MRASSGMPPPGRGLALIDLFAGLPLDVVQAVERRAHWHRFAANEQIFDRDDGERDVYFVISGAARIVNF